MMSKRSVSILHNNLFESTDNDMCGRLVSKMNESKLLL